MTTFGGYDVANLQKFGGQSKVSQDNSYDVAYDYQGQDVANKRADEVSGLTSSKAQALHDGKVGDALAVGRRIADLKGYLDAYNRTGGQGGFYAGAFGEVIPGVRKARESWKTGSDSSSGSEIAFHDPNSGRSEST